MSDYKMGCQEDHDLRHYEFARRYPAGLSRSRNFWQWLEDNQDAIVCIGCILLLVCGLIATNF